MKILSILTAKDAMQDPADVTARAREEVLAREAIASAYSSQRAFERLEPKPGVSTSTLRQEQSKRAVAGEDFRPVADDVFMQWTRPRSFGAAT